ncbi:hypothetical protein ACFSUJ_34605 [Streptomyces lusitanus]|uniref:hypothetical protein n=1 Tax=Streptomyces lusitanus TaxID=68232 RepID=UPI00363ED61B
MARREGRLRPARRRRSWRRSPSGRLLQRLEAAVRGGVRDPENEIEVGVLGEDGAGLRQSGVGSMACSRATTSTRARSCEGVDHALRAFAAELDRAVGEEGDLSLSAELLVGPLRGGLPSSLPPSRKLNWMSALWCSSDPPYVTQISRVQRLLAVASVASKTIERHDGRDLLSDPCTEVGGWVSGLLASLVVSRETSCFFAAAVESFTSVE